MEKIADICEQVLIDIEKALEYYSKSLEIRKESLPPNHPYMAMSENIISLYNLCLFFYNKRQFNIALEKYNELLIIFKKIYATDLHISIAVICHNIGFIYFKECEYDLSLKSYNESLRLKKILYGSAENISIAISHYCLAQVYESQGKFDLAQHNYSESIRIKKCTDPFHKGDDGNISITSDRFKNNIAKGLLFLSSNFLNLFNKIIIILFKVCFIKKLLKTQTIFLNMVVILISGLIFHLYYLNMKSIVILLAEGMMERLVFGLKIIYNMSFYHLFQHMNCLSILCAY